MTRIARKTLCAPSNYSGSCSGGTRWRCGVEVCAKKRRSPHAWVASSIFIFLCCVRVPFCTTEVILVAHRRAFPCEVVSTTKRSCAVVADVLCNCGHGYHLLCRYCMPVVILRQSMKNLYSFYVKQKAILCKERRNVKVQIHGIILAWCKVSILLVYPTFTRTYGKM